MSQEFDDNGRLLSRFFSDNGRTVTFTYDDRSVQQTRIGKLTSVSFHQAVSSFVPGVASASWSYRGNRVTSAGYEYHADGWPSAYPAAGSGARKELEDGYDGLLVSARVGTGAPVSFDCDGSGRRYRRSAQGLDRYELHDESGNLLADIDGDGDVRRQYVHAGKTLLARMDLSAGWSTVPAWSRAAAAAALGLLTCLLWWRQRRVAVRASGPRDVAVRPLRTAGLMPARVLVAELMSLALSSARC
ncbi:MAG: hypothetical protein HYV63_21460 [Candidatus Schekmanbacteria bacterium]|nr:hypothetical protein [Candidatus Schekmanbacteria bacterium]